MGTYHGWYSTKLGLALIAMALLFLAFACTRFADSLFGDFCMALVALAGSHHAANVLEKRGASTSGDLISNRKSDTP